VSGSASTRVRTGLADDLGPGSDWDLLSREASLFCRPPYLGYAASEGYDGFRVESRANGRLAAGAPGWIADGGGHFYLEPSQILRPLGVEEPRQVVVGSPGAFWGEVAVSLAPDRAAPDSMVEALRAHADAVDAAGAVALYLDDGSAGFVATSLMVERPALMNFDTVIEVPESFEAYLDGFTSHRRRELRRQIRRFADAGLRCTMEQSDACIVELAPVIAASEVRHGHASSPRSVATTLLRQRARLGSDFAIFAARDAGERLIAGAVAFTDADTVHVRICGIDPQVGPSAYAYFNVAYYAPIAHAVATGRRRVRLGLESFDAKLARGARLEARWGLLLGAGREPAARWRSAVGDWNRERVGLMQQWASRAPSAMDAAGRDELMRRAG